ncbi:MAG: AlpA family phage regulatory protein [Proteobacteria bacterium]|nr:AlpA family phage regulatory protein [Pseudomonadota bacterium]
MNGREREMEAERVLVRLPGVIRMTGLGRSTIYRLMAERKFPAPVKLAELLNGWRAADLAEWCDARRSSAGH